MKTKEEITIEIEKKWRESRSMKMDWLGLENCIRDVLVAKKNEIISSDDALALIDESVAAWALRGHELR